jgi:hypothetical protein
MPATFTAVGTTSALPAAATPGFSSCMAATAGTGEDAPRRAQA